MTAVSKSCSLSDGFSETVFRWPLGSVWYISVAPYASRRSFFSTTSGIVATTSRSSTGTNLGLFGSAAPGHNRSIVSCSCLSLMVFSSWLGLSQVGVRSR